jgi:hypothetical protein
LHWILLVEPAAKKLQLFLHISSWRKEPTANCKSFQLLAVIRAFVSFFVMAIGFSGKISTREAE